VTRASTRFRTLLVMPTTIAVAPAVAICVIRDGRGAATLSGWSTIRATARRRRPARAVKRPRWRARRAPSHAVAAAATIAPATATPIPAACRWSWSLTSRASWRRRLSSATRVLSSSRRLPISWSSRRVASRDDGPPAPLLPTRVMPLLTPAVPWPTARPPSASCASPRADWSAAASSRPNRGCRRPGTGRPR
jgi:hypothetical protein